MVRQARVLVIPYPEAGHTTPLLHFCKRLESKGVKVTFGVPIKIRKRLQIESYGLLDVETISDGFQEGEILSSQESHQLRFSSAVKNSALELIEKQNNSEEGPFQVLIYDSFMYWLLDVAHEKGLLGASFFIQMCSVSLLNYHIGEGTLKGLPHYEIEDSVVSLPGLPPVERHGLPLYSRFGSAWERVVKFMVGQFVNIDKADFVLCNSFDKFEPEAIEWMSSKWPMKAIGPTIFPSLPKKDQNKNYDKGQDNAENYMKWLDEREVGSVVYVAFGTIAALTQEEMEEFAYGLINSNCYFLWSMKASEESKLPKNFMTETSEKGVVVNWCNQLQVLAHPAVACFLGHAGINSIYEAIGFGVPAMVKPQLVDQTTAAFFVEDIWKVGIQVTGKRIGAATREEVERSIKEITREERWIELKRNIEKWKELAYEAMGKGGSSDRNIDDFISELLSFPNSSVVC